MPYYMETMTRSPYTPAGFEVFAEAQNLDYHASRRALRVWRRDTARMSGIPLRIAVDVYDAHPARRWHGEDRHVDACEVYGWRAALTAVRALRGEWPRGPGTSPRIVVGDAQLAAASDRWLDADTHEILVEYVDRPS